MRKLAEFKHIDRMINSFPAPTAEELENRDQTCIICREDMTIDTAVKLPCDHVLHTVCLRKWLMAHDSKVGAAASSSVARRFSTCTSFQICPVCRHDLSPYVGQRGGQRAQVHNPPPPPPPPQPQPAEPQQPAPAPQPQQQQQPQYQAPAQHQQPQPQPQQPVFPQAAPAPQQGPQAYPGQPGSEAPVTPGAPTAMPASSAAQQGQFPGPFMGAYGAHPATPGTMPMNAQMFLAAIQQHQMQLMQMQMQQQAQQYGFPSPMGYSAPPFTSPPHTSAPMFPPGAAWTPGAFPSTWMHSPLYSQPFPIPPAASVAEASAAMPTSTPPTIATAVATEEGATRVSTLHRRRPVDREDMD